MARAERYTARGQIPVEQAQLIDSGAFPADLSSAKALQVAGGVVNVFAELAIRKQAADDSLAANAASESRTLAELEMQQYIVDHPDPDDWDKGLTEILAKQGTTYSSQKFSAKAKKDDDIRQKAFLDRLKLNTKIAQTTQTIENNITASGKNLIDLISNDDGSPEDALNIKEQIKDYKEALERKITPELAAIQMEETLREAEKLKAENAKKDLMNRAVVKPKLMTSFIDAELKTRVKGKKGIPEFAMLSNTDLEAIRDYANSVGEKMQTDSTIALNVAIEDSYARIIKGDTDIASMITMIQADPTISEEDSSKAADKITTFFSKWNAIKIADESNEDVYDELTQASESVERGTLSPAAFEELYAINKEFLDKDDQRAIRSKDIVATKTMQNRAFTDAMSATLPTLVELTESDLGAIKLARQNAEIIKDIASVNLFNIAIKKNQAERWNYGRFRKQLRSQIDQNPEWSQKQIFVAQEILVDQLDIPVDQLLIEFDAQNPDKAIMKTPPNIDFKDIWPDLSIDDKAKIWELTMRGAPAEAILGVIE